MNRDITVTIPVFNQSHLTRRCLESLLSNSTEVLEVIIVDNASKDDTPSLLQSFKPQFIDRGMNFIVIRNEENQGFGRACNQGIFSAKGAWIAVLNNDTWVMPGWDHALKQAAARLKADMVGPYYDENPFDEHRLKSFSERFTRKNRGRNIRSWVSILMFFRRESILKVNGFDPEYFVTWEDYDLKHRMELEGMRYFQIGDCVIWHHSKGTRSSLPSEHEKQGQKIFLRKWNFDPRTEESTIAAKVRRRWLRIRRLFGYL